MIGKSSGKRVPAMMLSLLLCMLFCLHTAQLFSRASVADDTLSVNMTSDVLPADTGTNAGNQKPDQPAEEANGDKEKLPDSDYEAGDGELAEAGRNGSPRLRDEITQPPDLRSAISLSKILWTVVFLLAGYFVIKAIAGIFSLFALRHPRYKITIRRIMPLVKIIGWSFVVYIIITLILQPPVETVFAFFASIGVAIGFASQDFLKNIFGGLMILVDKPFQIGDKIESGKYYGEVLEIGLRSTRVVTPDDSVVTIPNSEMMNQSISNANFGENNCQVVAELFLPLGIDTKHVRRIATEAAQVSKYVYLNKPIMVEFSNVLVPKGSFLKMRLKAYVMDVRYEFPFQSEMTEIVLRELYAEGLLQSENNI
ncbi:MAG: mechanosensitive ion channel family protein [Bacteroidales bacterium]|nr:mechanosensitive ion channel family protein [Bacteroidales bacterium]